MVSPSSRRGRDVSLPLKKQTITPHIGKVLVYANHSGCLCDGVSRFALFELNVRFGTKADIGSGLSDVRFSPESGRQLVASDIRLSAKGRHPPCSLFPYFGSRSSRISSGFTQLFSVQ
jgi:hypothetical protein